MELIQIRFYVYIIVPFWYTLFNGTAGELVEAIIRILMWCIWAKIPTERPDKPGMPLKCTKKGVITKFGSESMTP